MNMNSFFWNSNKKVPIRPQLVLIFFSLIVGIGCLPENSKTTERTARKKHTAMTETYPRLFADTRRSCFIPVKINAKGILDAQIPFDVERTPDFDPLFLLVSDCSVVACAAQAITGFNPAGKSIWHREVRYGRPIQIKSGRVYFLATDTARKTLSAIDLDGNPIGEKMFILNTNRNSGPIYIEPKEDGFIAHCLCPQGSGDGNPMMVFYKKEYSTKEYDWVLDLEDQAILPPL
ncbi:MAG: hypothetical protein D3924_12220, partial [Candidatus Electrothrix sp. AR4]|nr:hypothetical protein [Candidatus Electrothrix sp. AR4]